MQEAVAAIHLTDISAATAEQSSGMGQIGETVQHMDQTTQQNAAMVEELSAAARSLQDQAQDQVQTIAVFTLPRDGAPAHNPPEWMQNSARQHPFRHSRRDDWPWHPQLLSGPEATPNSAAPLAQAILRATSAGRPPE